MAIQAWFMQENGDDQRLPHHKNPPEYVSLDELADVGVLYWNLDPNKYENDPDLNKIRQERGYSYMDLLDLCPEKVENYEQKLKNFYTEHIHGDEEIRYCLEGSGYFDVRDKDDRWIRIHINAGDLIVLPAGIYHRFTLDTTNYIKLMRLFVGEPVWTPFNRPQEDHHARKEYIKTITHKAFLQSSKLNSFTETRVWRDKEKGNKMGSLTKDTREEVIQAWYMDDSDEDQRLPHHRNPKEFVSFEKLDELGVLSWRLDADNYETDPELKKIREDRGYSYMDFCEVCPEKLPNYEEKIKNFYEEHLHTDEEIRYCVAGSGYFDVRDRDEGWIRIWVKKGAMIVLPAGIYHRFTLDSDNYIKAMRLFVGDPVWTPFNRPHDHLPARQQYVENFVKKAGAGQAVDATA